MNYANKRMTFIRADGTTITRVKKIPMDEPADIGAPPKATPKKGKSRKSTK